MKSPDSKLRQWVDHWHDGTISAQDALLLEKRLVEDPDARRYFFEVAEIEAVLPLVEAGIIAVPNPTRPRWGGILRWAAVFVAGLFVGTLPWLPGWLTTRFNPVASIKPPVATVSGMRGITWEDRQNVASMALAPNELMGIKSGLIELGLASGTRVLIEGPAKFAVTGGNEVRLTHGKLVADVPKGAEGFTVEYPDGKIIDLGTEFAANVAPDGGAARFGVFRGEIECLPGSFHDKAFRLQEGHAVLLKNGEAHTIPFDQSEFVRELPSREFSWKIAAGKAASTTWEFDVSHLIYKPGVYRMIAKQFSGSQAVRFENASLVLNGGDPVSKDVHDAVLPIGLRLGVGNAYTLEIPNNLYHRGRWTLRVNARIESDERTTENPESSGIVLFEEGVVSEVSPSEFMGTWEYMHDGMVFHRTFLPDGSCKLTINGKPYNGFDGSRWRVEKGNLILKLRDEFGRWFEESHCLRNPKTLTFINRPYRDAKLVKSRVD